MVLGNLHFMKVNVDTDKRYPFPHKKNYIYNLWYLAVLKTFGKFRIKYP